MCTCYEHLRKPQDPNKKQSFDRLQGYFRALEQGKTNEYHDLQDKRKKIKKERKNVR